MKEWILTVVAVLVLAGGLTAALEAATPKRPVRADCLPAELPPRLALPFPGHTV